MADDKDEAFIDYFERMTKKDIQASVFTLKWTIVEGNYVVLHCYQEWPSDIVMVVIGRALIFFD